MQLNPPNHHHLNAKYGWKLLGILGLMMLISFVVFLASIAAYFVFFHDRTSVHSFWLYSLLNEPSTIAFQLLLTYLALLFTPLILIWKFGFEARHLFYSHQAKLFHYLVAILLIIAASILIDQSLFLLIGGRSEDLDVGNYFAKLEIAHKLRGLNDSSLISSQLLLFLTLIAGPVLEEMIFRNVLWKAFRSQYSFLYTTAITSFFYALIHFEPIQGLSSFFIGFIYSYIVEKTHSVFPCVLAHIATSYLTFFMSENGLRYGVGGSSYPWAFLLPSIFTSIICIFYLMRLSNNVNNLSNTEASQQII